MFPDVRFQKSVDQYPWFYKKETISSRFVEKPNLPPGVASKIENNYYCQRDLVSRFSNQLDNSSLLSISCSPEQRRAVEPPMVTGSQAMLQEAYENVTRSVRRY